MPDVAPGGYPAGPFPPPRDLDDDADVGAEEGADDADDCDGDGVGVGVGVGLGGGWNAYTDKVICWLWGNRVPCAGLSPATRPSLAWSVVGTMIGVGLTLQLALLRLRTASANFWLVTSGIGSLPIDTERVTGAPGATVVNAFGF